MRLIRRLNATGYPLRCQTESSPDLPPKHVPYLKSGICHFMFPNEVQIPVPEDDSSENYGVWRYRMPVSIVQSAPGHQRNQVVGLRVRPLDFILSSRMVPRPEKCAPFSYSQFSCSKMPVCNSMTVSLCKPLCKPDVHRKFLVIYLDKCDVMFDIVASHSYHLIENLLCG